MKRWLVALTLVAAACSGAATPTSTTPESTTAASAPTTSRPIIDTTAAPRPTSEPQTLEVEVPAGGLALAGTLYLPEGDAPAPGVVLIHGSGPINRASEVPGQLNMTFGFDIAVFEQIAEALQDAGIAVLTYDKRTCGRFNRCADNDHPFPPDELTIDTFIDDAASAVGYLRGRPEVDPDAITVVGHSQGAQFITVMLEADPQLASGVMIAAPYRPIDEIFEFQLESTIDLLVDLGIPEEQAAASPALELLVEIVDGLVAIRAGGNERVAGLTGAFWRSWLDLHERALSAAFRITQPLLVLSGELDWNVPPAEATAWGEFLAEAGADFQVLTFPCVTHALNCVAEDDPAEMRPADIGRDVEPEVIDALLAFLAR